MQAIFKRRILFVLALAFTRKLDFRKIEKKCRSKNQSSHFGLHRNIEKKTNCHGRITGRVWAVIKKKLVSFYFMCTLEIAKTKKDVVVA